MKKGTMLAIGFGVLSLGAAIVYLQTKDNSKDLQSIETLYDEDECYEY